MGNVRSGRALSPLFWLEAVAALICGVALIATLNSPEWIEEVFHVDPDEGSGQLEWLIVVVLCAVTLALLAAAGWEWRRSAGRSRA